MKDPRTSGILLKMPAGIEEDPAMNQLVRDLRPGMRRTGRYMRVAEHDPDFGKALRLTTTILGQAQHPTLRLGDILDSDDWRSAYLLFILGACRRVMAACDLPANRTEQLIAGAFFSYDLFCTAPAARWLGRAAVALEQVAELESPFVAGQAAASRWLADMDSDTIRLFSLDGVLNHATTVAARVH